MTRRAVRTPADMGALPPVRRLRHRCATQLIGMWLTTLTFVNGCAPTRPMPAPVPTPAPASSPIPVPEKPVPIDPLAEPWVVGVPRSPITHEITVTAAVRAAATTPALASATADTLRTLLSVRWDSTSRATARSGAVLDYRIDRNASGRARANTVPEGLALPVALSASLDVEHGVVRITAPDESGCGADAAVAQTVREVLVGAPRRLVRGASWRDSLRATVCRDSIPLTLVSIRSYVVEDARVEGGRVVVMIRRRSSSTFSGMGTQFGEPVTITGEGQGELLFGLGLDDGQMVDGNGLSTLTLSLTGRRKSQVVTQNARVEIRRR